MQQELALHHARRDRSQRATGLLGNLFADGIRSDDYWNQQFLFCRDPGWGAGQYGIYANRGGLYWNGSVSGDVTWVGATAAGIESPEMLFAVTRFDSTWWSIRWVGFRFAPYYYVAPHRNQSGNPLGLTLGPRNGNNLFRISPSDLMG